MTPGTDSDRVDLSGLFEILHSSQSLPVIGSVLRVTTLSAPEQECKLTDRKFCPATMGPLSQAISIMEPSLFPDTS